VARTLARCRDGAAPQWAKQAQRIALRGWGDRADKRARQIHTGNLRILAAEAFWLLGDCRSAHQLVVAARKAFPEGYPNAQLSALRARLGP
jgi:hypothetical protein